MSAPSAAPGAGPPPHAAASAATAAAATSSALAASSSSSSSSSATLQISHQNALIVSLIHDAQALCVAANRQAATAAERERKLEKAWTKLLTAQAELGQQAHGCAQVVAQLAERCQALESGAEALSTDFTARQAELQAVLDTLASRPLTSCLQPVRSPSPAPQAGDPAAPSSQLQTLFDFVDSESLAQVHAHFLRRMERLAQLAESARGILARGEAQLTEARSLEAQLLERMQSGGAGGTLVLPVLPPLPFALLPAGATAAAPADASDVSVLGHCRYACALLQHEAADGGQMQLLFSAMCGSYDRVRQARAQPQQSGATTSSADISAEILSMQQSVQQLQVHSHRSTMLLAHVDACSNAHASLYTQTLQLFNALQAFGPSLNSALASFSSLQLEYESESGNAASSVAELRNLCGFYIEFERAYDALLQEIQRRHRQMSHQQALMQTLRSQLSEVVQAEVAEREAFWSAHGRFLPPALCPALTEPVIDVRIVPEELRTELPVHIPTEAEAAHAAHVAELRQREAAFAASQPPASQAAADTLDHSGHAAQVSPALSASAQQAAAQQTHAHVSQADAQQQQQQQQQQQEQSFPQLDSLQDVLGREFGAYAQRPPAAATRADGSLHAPTPTQAHSQWHSQQLASQAGASSLPPSSLLAHSATAAPHLHSSIPPQLGPAEATQPSRTLSQPVKHMPRGFDDDD